MIGSGRELTRAEVMQLLGEVGGILQERGLEAAIYVVGGAAMAIEYESRRITRDVDAAIRTDRDEFWQAARAVAERHGLNPHWINTNATAFLTNVVDHNAAEVNLPGLRMIVASPEHLIAMKLRAMRPRDLADLDFLFRYLGLTTPEQAAEIHNRLFDDSYIGYHDPGEALFAAQDVFRRAEASGFPIERGPRDRGTDPSHASPGAPSA